jgi:hypothetical protein
MNGIASRNIETDPWMLTASGRRVTPLAMTADQVHWSDIAEALSKINRFNGCTSVPYTVAQHSVMVARLLPPEIRIHGLLHDAHEAYLGDITRPVKKLLAQFGDGAGAIEAVSRMVDGAIYDAAGLGWPVSPAIANAVRIADDAMLAAELAQLFPDSADTRQAMAELRCDPAPVSIRPHNRWVDSADEFREELAIALDLHRARAA